MVDNIIILKKGIAKYFKTYISTYYENRDMDGNFDEAMEVVLKDFKDKYKLKSVKIDLSKGYSKANLEYLQGAFSKAINDYEILLSANEEEGEDEI